MLTILPCCCTDTAPARRFCPKRRGSSTPALLFSFSPPMHSRRMRGVLDQTTGLLTITQTQFNNLKSLFFEIGNVTYELTANAQIWPRSQNEAIGGDPNKIYLVTADVRPP
ncbi:hypothetical protein BD410DRAFT_642720 [Rickenella mellea]|uniref:Uncharacterized protein n=1 Tax=Rickenella mellea TaxID=50990 RepID=A0A4Y7PMP0_9AGAM|nr:hypothetical protein BD410DRAFT_642720 [Rickenella mellea]